MKSLKNLLSWAKPFSGLIVVIIALTILSPLTYSYVPQFIKYIIDVCLSSSQEGSVTLPLFLLQYFDTFEDMLSRITVVGVVLVVFQLLRGMLMFANGYAKGKLAENITYDMRTKLFTHIQNLSYSYHNHVDTGDLIQRCTSDIGTIQAFISNQLPEIVYIICSFAAGAIQMSLINVQIMLVTLCIVPISVTTSIIYFRYVTSKFQAVEESESEMTVVLQENVNGVRVVKAFNTERNEIKRFDKTNKEVRDKSLKLNNGMAYYWGSSDCLTMLQYALTVFVCLLFARTGVVSTGDIVACMMYIGMLVWPIRSLGRIINDFGRSVVASNRIKEILDIKEEYEVDGTLTPEIKGNIEFNDVSFKFEDTDQHLLKDVTFNINVGETVAIVGKTGSGKSTIVNLLERMLEYDQGEILIDGINIKDIQKRHLRKHIGIVLQDPFLYAKTVFDNIRIANENADEKEVYHAAEIASVHNDIETFDQGYNTLVGEKGVTLSGGQKQRVAIARMLVLEKPVIIFDDSLSAVDTTTDLQIRNALKKENKNLTTIIITHRITTAKEADKIIVLENGSVSEIGTHDELANKPGLYKELWDIQGALEDEFMKIINGGGE